MDPGSSPCLSCEAHLNQSPLVILTNIAGLLVGVKGKCHSTQVSDLELLGMKDITEILTKRIVVMNMPEIN